MLPACYGLKVQKEQRIALGAGQGKERFSRVDWAGRNPDVLFARTRNSPYGLSKVQRGARFVK